MILNIIGFDPSFTSWGCAYGTYDTDIKKIEISSIITICTSPVKSKTVRKSSDRIRRGAELHKGIIDSPSYAHVIFSEIPTGSQSAVAAFGLGIVTGILSTINPKVIEILPHETKLASVGSKVASKQQMIDWATSLYPNLNWPLYRGSVAKKAEHMADAIAVIHAGINTSQFKQLINLVK